MVHHLLLRGGQHKVWLLSGYREVRVAAGAELHLRAGGCGSLRGWSASPAHSACESVQLAVEVLLQGFYGGALAWVVQGDGACDVALEGVHCFHIMQSAPRPLTPCRVWLEVAADRGF